MTMYDLTGVESQGRGPGRNRTAAQINQILAQPDALRTVATIVHEATHQIAFNCGLHTRLSDCPLWFSEGIAEYFETPDLRSAKGWSGIGKDVNQPRLEQFQQYLAARPANSLETLLRDDTRFRDPKQSLDAYAEAWALTYFLIRQHPKEYVAYLAMLSKKKPLLPGRSREAARRVPPGVRRIGGGGRRVPALHGPASVKHVRHDSLQEPAGRSMGPYEFVASEGGTRGCPRLRFGLAWLSVPSSHCVMKNPG